MDLIKLLHKDENFVTALFTVTRIETAQRSASGAQGQKRQHVHTRGSMQPGKEKEVLPAYDRIPDRRRVTAGKAATVNAEEEPLCTHVPPAWRHQGSSAVPWEAGRAPASPSAPGVRSASITAARGAGLCLCSRTQPRRSAQHGAQSRPRRHKRDDRLSESPLPAQEPDVRGRDRTCVRSAGP